LHVIRAHLIMLCLALLGAAVLIVGCGGSKSLTMKSAHELFELGRKEFDNKKYFKAIELFQLVVYNYPGESIVDTAQYYLGLSYFGNEEYELAGVEFNRMIVNYPSSAYFEHAIFMKAVSFFESTPRHYGLDQTDLQEAIKQFEDFIIDFPESELMPDVQKYLLRARSRMARKYYESGIVYSRMRAFEAAKIYFQKVIDDYTDTDYGPRASYKYAEMEFKLKQFDEASKKFRDFGTVFPEHEWSKKAAQRAIEAAFRSGEVAFKKGDYSLAQQKLEAFQTDFPDNGWTKKVGKYLDKIYQITRQRSQSDETDS
jgi:outer membrane protein assembly factor BamD